MEVAIQIREVGGFLYFATRLCANAGVLTVDAYVAVLCLGSKL